MKRKGFALIARSLAKPIIRSHIALRRPLGEIRHKTVYDPKTRKRRKPTPKEEKMLLRKMHKKELKRVRGLERAIRRGEVKRRLSGLRERMAGLAKMPEKKGKRPLKRGKRKGGKTKQ